MLDVDARLENADWTKQSPDAPIGGYPTWEEWYLRLSPEQRRALPAAYLPRQEELRAAGWEEREHPRHPDGRWRRKDEAPEAQQPDTSDIHTVGSARDPGWTGPELRPENFDHMFMGARQLMYGQQRSDQAWDPTFTTPLGATSTVDRAVQQEAERLNDLTTQEYKRAVGENAANELRGAELATRTDLEALVGIAEDGVFRTQFETARSGGAFFPEGRAAQERMFFGYPQDQLEDRPIYGYAVTPAWDDFDESRVGNQYGPVRWQLKPDELRSRTTVSGVDSLGRRVMPGPINNPGWRSTLPPGYNDTAMVRTKRDELTWGYGDGDVAEAQYHGGLTLDDVASMQLEVDEDFLSRHPELTEAVARLRQRGINVEVVGWR